tara:strand:+ start:457 stop:1542 length:1086 start_codon:yes stop_codon:yes gene_type:complete
MIENFDPIDANGYLVEFSEKAYNSLNAIISKGEYSSMFILVDSNSGNLCLEYFLNKLNNPKDFRIIEVKAGEEYKSLSTCDFVWRYLSENAADRKSLLINLGGGVISDLGGFVASTYMRGIDFINIPTTLLSMVDASIGGKLGIDLDNLKNQIGVIANPCLVVIDSHFLKSLPDNEFLSGYAEMLKHGLIKNEKYFESLINHNFLTDKTLIEGYIHKSITIKNNVVKKDQREFGERKLLNFGHTLGHAIESFFLNQKKESKLLHGEAVAAGMILESFISFKVTGLPLKQANYIASSINKLFAKIQFSRQGIISIIDLIKHDKKNIKGKNNFTLLLKAGDATINNTVSSEIMQSAFDMYEAS